MQKNSLEAVETYCKVFGAKATLEMFNEAHTEYEHCELSVEGRPILAVSEAPEEWDVNVIHAMRWQGMTFNAFELGRHYHEYSRRFLRNAAVYADG